MKALITIMSLFMMGNLIADVTKEEQSLFCKATYEFVAYDSADNVQDLKCNLLKSISIQNMKKLEGHIKLILNGKNISYVCDFVYIGNPETKNIIGGIELINCNNI